MKIGPFISLLSSTYGVPEKTVVVLARTLREVGFLTSGARGVNAPDMGARDAARLTLAVLTGEPPSKLISEFEFLRTLQTPDEYPSAGLLNRETLPLDHIFEDALTVLFDASADPELITEYGEEKITHVIIPDDDLVDGYDLDTVTDIIWPRFSVAVDMSQRTAMVRVPDGTFHYLDLAGRERFKQLRAKPPTDLVHYMEELLTLEARSPSTVELDGVVKDRGMRVVRTITEQEFKRIVEGMEAGVSPSPSRQKT